MMISHVSYAKPWKEEWRQPELNGFAILPLETSNV